MALSGASAFGTAFAAGTGKIFWDVSSRALSFVLSVAVARRLGASGYGSFAVYWYSAWMLSQATDLGIHLVSLRALSRSSESDARRIFRSAALAKAVLSAGVLGALALAFISGASGAFSFELRLATLLVAAHLMSSWMEFFGIVLRSRGRIAREGFLLTALRLSWLLSALWALSRGARLDALATALAFSCLPALALAPALLAKSGWLAGKGEESAPFSLRFEARRLLREALPLGLVSAITLVYLRADLLIVAALRDAGEAGLFQSAFRLFEGTFVLSGGIAAGTFPLLAARMGEKGFDSLSRFVLALLVSLGLLIASAFALAPAPILALVYGSGFREAARPLAYLGIALVAVFANALTTHLLVAAARHQRLVAAISTRLIVGLVLDLVLVPRWGARGAAIAVLCAEWSLLAMSLLSTADLLGFSFLPRRGVSREEVSPCS